MQFRQLKPHPEVSISQHKYNLNYNNPNTTGKNPTPLMIPFTNIPIQVFFHFFSTYGQLNQLEAKSYSSDILKEVSSRGGSTHGLLGNYTKAGEVFRIDVVLHEVTRGETIGSEREEGKGQESFFPMVDELTRTYSFLIFKI